MANIIRCALPDGIHRFKPFTVADYRDFLLVRNDMETKEDAEQEICVDELTSDYFEKYPKTWRHYIFLQVFTGSIGKTKLPIVYECPVCGKKQKRLFNLEQQPLVAPVLELSPEVKLIFKFPDNDYEDMTKLIMENIDKVDFRDKVYNWTDLDNMTKDNILDLLDFEKFEEIVKRLKPIYFEMKVRCCEKHTLVYDSIASIFNLLINPDEVFPFYEINHILQKNNYDLNSIMNMLPVERSIALSLIEKDNKK